MAVFCGKMSPNEFCVGISSIPALPRITNEATTRRRPDESCTSDIFQAKTIRGATKIPAELRYRVEIRLLRRRRQIADRHVLDHAAAKRADLSHRKTSRLKVGCEPTILSERRQSVRPLLKCRGSGSFNRSSS